MKNKLVWVLGGVAAVVLLAWALRPQATEVELATVNQGRFERAVQEDGKTRLRERYVVSAPLTGRISRIALREGDVVEQGATLATLWPAPPAMPDERTRDEQEARRAAMQAALARAGANVGRASAALEQARTELKRSEALAESGFLSATQIEAARVNLRLREREQESARQDENLARHEFEQAGVALRQYFSDRPGASQKPWPIRAPVAGPVLKIMHLSEGLVQAGTGQMELGDPRHLEVVVALLTEDAAQIQPGTPVQLGNWGGPGALDGRVRLIEPAAFTKVSALGVEEQRVNAVIDISTHPEGSHRLGDGYKVDVRVLVQVVENALTVPVSALFPLGARSALFVVEGGRARQREVDVAARNGVQAWVKNGLTPGASVIVYPPTSLKDGARISTR